MGTPETCLPRRFLFLCYPSPLLVVLVQAWLPESPRWLLLSGATRDRAEGAVRRAWGASASDDQAVRQEVAAMVRDNPAASSGALPLHTHSAPLLHVFLFSVQLQQQLSCDLCL